MSQGGDIFGDFQIREDLGTGGMGTVHLAVHTTFGTEVALKQLRVLDDEAQAAFLEEARAVCRLDHPHIARIFDYGVQDGIPWFAMELARSTLVAEAVAAKSWRTLGAINRQLLDALAHAHARGVVHRDLKPNNVLMATADDLRPGVKLVDFGIAATSSQSIQRAGTPAYMAPEQWSGDLPSVGPWTDLYALGALFWTLCCGRPPVVHDDLAVIWGRQERNELDDFSPRLSVPGGLEDWLRTCLRAHPTERFACVADALVALDAVESGADSVTRVPRPVSASAETLRSSDLSTFVLDDDGTSRPPPSPPRHRPPPCPVPETFEPRNPKPPAAPIAGLSLRVLPWIQAPVVGREREQLTLWQHLVGAEAERRPRTVVLQGVPGAGRSALGQWVVRHARKVTGARAVVATEGSGLQGLVDGLLQPYGMPGDTNGRHRGLVREQADGERAIAAVDALSGQESGPRAAGMVLDVLQAVLTTRTLLVFADASDSPGLQGLANRWQELHGAALLVLTDLRTPDAQELPVPPMTANAVAQTLRALLPLHPTLVRQITDRSAGMPAEVASLLTLAAPNLRLGPHGFELPGGFPEAKPIEALQDLSDDDRHLVEVLAHLDPSVPVSLWAQVTGRRRTELLGTAARLAVSALATTEAGGVRLSPAVRNACQQQAERSGRDRAHHLAIATVLDDHEALPQRRGQAWIDAGDPVRGVTVWLDNWRHLLEGQGFEVTEGLLLEAQILLASEPRTEALHGRLEAILPVLATRNHGSAPPAAALERFRLALEAGWWDTAADHLRWAAVCTDPKERNTTLEREMPALEGRCSPGAWAALHVYAVMSGLQWTLELDSPWIRHAEEAVTKAEQDLVCGHSTIISPELLPRLRHRLLATVATLKGDHEAAARAMRIVVDVARAASSPTLAPDRVDLGLAELAAGRPAAAEAVFADGERSARWIGAYTAVSAFISQRAGMAVLTGDWDRAARFARAAEMGLPEPYAMALMRLIAIMPAVADGHLGQVKALMPELIEPLCIVTPPDAELRECMALVQRQFADNGEMLPEAWEPLLATL